MARPIILVHGAWHGAWCFEKLIALLRARSVQVEAINLPLQGTQGDIETAQKCIEDNPGAVVLGHSYGGLVVTHASLACDVSHLVYLCALMPDKDEDVAETIAAAPAATALDEAIVPSDDGTISINPALASTAFYDDCAEEDVISALGKLRAQRFEPFPVLHEDPPWRHVQSTYVVCREDKALHPELQHVFAQRAANSIELPGAHSPFLSRPEEVAEILLKLVD